MESEQSQQSVRTTANARRTIIVTSIVTVVATCLLGAAGVSLLRQFGCGFFYMRAKKPFPAAAIARKWLDAVKSGETKKAITYAEMLVPDHEPRFPTLDYLQILKMNNITSVYLTDGFNNVDFIRWKDLVTLKELADTLGNVTGVNELNAMKTLVMKKVQAKKIVGMKYPPLSVCKVLEQGFGNNVDRMRLFAELARQRGYDTRIIAIKEPRSQRSIHLLCELSKNGRTSMVDLTFNKIWDGISYTKLKSTPDLVPPKWPKALKQCIPYDQILFPNEIQDYKMANRTLFDRLTKLYGDSPGNLPVLPTDPKSKIEQFVKSNREREMRVRYWQIPIVALLSRRKDLPKLWLFEQEKGGNAEKTKN